MGLFSVSVQCFPDGLVVGFAVAPVEGCFVGDAAFYGACG